MTFVAISVGAVLGANLRYLLGGWLSTQFGSSFPYATLVINVTGSLVIGLVIGSRLGPGRSLVVDTGRGGRLPGFVHDVLDIQLRNDEPHQ